MIYCIFEQLVIECINHITIKCLDNQNTYFERVMTMCTLHVVIVQNFGTFYYLFDQIHMIFLARFVS